MSTQDADVRCGCDCQMCGGRSIPGTCTHCGAIHRVHVARRKLLKDPQAKDAYDAQRARIDARVAEKRGTRIDGDA